MKDRMTYVITTGLFFLTATISWANVALMDTTGIRKVIFTKKDPTSGSEEVRLRVCATGIPLSSMTPDCVGSNGQPIEELAVHLHHWVEAAEKLSVELDVDFRRLLQQIRNPHHKNRNSPPAYIRSDNEEWLVAVAAFRDPQIVRVEVGRSKERKNNIGSIQGENITVNPIINHQPIINNGGPPQQAGKPPVPAEYSYQCETTCHYTEHTHYHGISGLPEYIPPADKSSSMSQVFKTTVRGLSVGQAEDKAKRITDANCQSACNSGRRSSRYFSTSRRGCRISSVNCH